MAAYGSFGSGCCVEPVELQLVRQGRAYRYGNGDDRDDADHDIYHHDDTYYDHHDHHDDDHNRHDIGVRLRRFGRIHDADGSRGFGWFGARFGPSRRRLWDDV